MAENQTPEVTAAENRGFWAGMRAGVTNGTNWMWAHRPQSVSFKWVVLIIIVVALFAFREDIGRFISGNQPQTASLTQADVDRAVAAALAAQNSQTNSCPTGQIETVTFGCLPEADARIVLGLEGRSNEELEQMLNPDNGNSTTSANPGDTSNSGTADADSTTSAPVTFTCDGNTIRVPENGQLFEATVWRNGNPVNDPCYNVVYDPIQSGVSYLEGRGWWYQPLLPGPEREYHEVSIVLQTGSYKFVGPECKVWVAGNTTTQTGRNGTLLVDRRNVETLTVPATAGAPAGESWVFVECRESEASGFSFAKR